MVFLYRLDVFRSQNIIPRSPWRLFFLSPSCPCDFEHNERRTPSLPSWQRRTIMLTQTLPPSPACYAAQCPTFTATVNNTARCFYSANALFFITDLLGHHDIPSFLPPPTSPPLTHPAARGVALLCHMCNNKWALRCFVHARILQGACCKSLRRTPTRLWIFAEFQKIVILIFTGEKMLTVLVADWFNNEIQHSNLKQQ